VEVDGQVDLNAARLPKLHKDPSIPRRRSRRICVDGLGLIGCALDHRCNSDRSPTIHLELACAIWDVSAITARAAAYSERKRLESTAAQ
jgi:hypothetical protein